MAALGVPELYSDMPPQGRHACLEEACRVSACSAQITDTCDEAAC